MSKGKISPETVRNLAKIKPHIGTSPAKEIARITGVPVRKVTYLLSRYPTGELTKEQRESAKLPRGNRVIMAKMTGKNYQPVVEKDPEPPFQPDLTREPGVVYWGDHSSHYFFEPGKKSSKKSDDDDV